MTYCNLLPASGRQFPAAQAALLFSILIAGTATGCAAFSSEKPAESVQSDKPATPSPIVVDDEVPNVDNCHTDTQVCALEESLQPGLACFCSGGDGANEPGSAGE